MMIEPHPDPVPGPDWTSITMPPEFFTHPAAIFAWALLAAVLLYVAARVLIPRIPTRKRSKAKHTPTTPPATPQHGRSR